MSQTTPIEPIELPWVEAKEDKLFIRIVWISIILFLTIGVILNSLTLPEIEQKTLKEVAPRLAQLILEKQKKPEPKKVIPPKKVEEKPKPKPKEKEPEPKPKEQKPIPKKEIKPDRQAAREKAQQSGLLALQDELADLRDSFEFEEIADLPQLKEGKEAKKTQTTSDLLTAKATANSGGIKTSTTPKSFDKGQLAAKKANEVQSNIKNIESAKVSKSSQKVGTRSQEEIEQVFQKNKGSIFSIYNRELRKDPSLQGKVVLELTIEPNGTVSKVNILSSELNHQKLERRLISKVKKFKFASKKVKTITVTYPIFFLPS